MAPIGSQWVRLTPLWKKWIHFNHFGLPFAVSCAVVVSVRG
ncbi:MAG: hypothetical protein VCE43_14495 [Myxococcota bacterium]